MNTIQQRLEIFKNSGILVDNEADILKEWARIIEDSTEECDYEKLERMITHCAMMMKRQRNNEDIGELDYEIFSNVQKHESYENSKQLFDKMNEIYPINTNESGYMVLHLCNCISKGENE